jgi:hypothetical protein
VLKELLDRYAGLLKSALLACDAALTTVTLPRAALDTADTWLE